MTLLALWALLAAGGGSAQAAAADQYGARGVFPVYEVSGQWTIFDKRPGRNPPGPLAVGRRFLVIGSSGAETFAVARSSPTYGAACRAGKQLRLRAALLRGPRSAVGRPIMAIAVPDSFSLSGSRASYRALKNEVDGATYERLLAPLREDALNDVRNGRFPFVREDEGAGAAAADPRPEAVQQKIDFGASVAVDGLSKGYAFVEESRVSASTRRCLRLADGAQLIGGCAEMPRALMAETALLFFVAYDPSGRGKPYLLAFTPKPPLWGDERWGFVLRGDGPKLFMTDALDPRCRESF